MEAGYPADDPVQPLSGEQRLTPLLVHLLKGILYRDIHTQLWQQLYDLASQKRLNQAQTVGMYRKLNYLYTAAPSCIIFSIFYTYTVPDS